MVAMVTRETRSPVSTPPCSDEELSKQSRRQHPACAVECSLKIGRAIRCQSLQALQQLRDGHKGCPDHQRPGPGEAEHQRECGAQAAAWPRLHNNRRNLTRCCQSCLESIAPPTITDEAGKRSRASGYG